MSQKIVKVKYDNRKCKQNQILLNLFIKKYRQIKSNLNHDNEINGILISDYDWYHRAKKGRSDNLSRSCS